MHRDVVVFGCRATGDITFKAIGAAKESAEEKWQELQEWHSLRPAACCLQQGGRRNDKYAGGTRHANSQWGAATTRIAFDLPIAAEAATTPATAVGLDSLEMENAEKKNQEETREENAALRQVELMMPLRKDDYLYQ